MRVLSKLNNTDGILLAADCQKNHTPQEVKACNSEIEKFVE